MTGRSWDVFALAARLVMALVWLYNGLWLKVVARDPHHERIIASVFGEGGAASAAMLAIGWMETLLALAIASGRASTPVNVLQIILLLGMNAAGILGSGEIARPAGLLISNLPLVLCAAMIAWGGPGRWVFPPLPKGASR